MAKLPIPLFCPRCAGPLRRETRIITMCMRSGLQRVRRVRRVCQSCRVAVVLHRLARTPG